MLRDAVDGRTIENL